MINNFIVDIIKNVFPMIFIFTVILISVRIVYLISMKQKFVLYKELLTLLGIIYLLLLYYIVTFQDNNYGTNNFMLFKEILRYKVTSTLFIKNVLGNIVLFIPFGIFVSHFIKKRNVLYILFLSIVTSFSIEFIQYKIGRTVDVDDIVLNVVGGIIGYFIYTKLLKYKNNHEKLFRKDYFLNFISIIIILIILYAAYYFKIWRYI